MKHWDLFEEDVERMKEIGLRAYRYSVDWSRVGGEVAGQWDEEALARYVDWARQLRDAGIVPVVSLYHWSHPKWIERYGSWEDDRIVEDFMEFVKKVVPPMIEAGVTVWGTMNEPLGRAVTGWLALEQPPFVEDLKRALQVAKNMLKAHVAAYRYIHSLQEAAVVGFVKNVVDFRPRKWWNPADKFATKAMQKAMNHAYFETLRTGRFTVKIAPGMDSIDEEIPDSIGAYDAVFLNHYFRLHTGFNVIEKPKGLTGGHPRLDGIPQSDMGWNMDPHSFLNVLREMSVYTTHPDGRKRPIMVTEHGCADDGQPDNRRLLFVYSSLWAMRQAMAEGIDIRGYLHWSFLDNFEWTFSFAMRFGLYRVDFESQKRTLTRGGKLYGDIAKAFDKENESITVDARAERLQGSAPPLELSKTWPASEHCKKLLESLWAEEK